MFGYAANKGIRRAKGHKFPAPNVKRLPDYIRYLNAKACVPNGTKLSPFSMSLPN